MQQADRRVASAVNMSPRPVSDAIALFGVEPVWCGLSGDVLVDCQMQLMSLLEVQ